MYIIRSTLESLSWIYHFRSRNAWLDYILVSFYWTPAYVSTTFVFSSWFKFPAEQQKENAS